MSRRSMTDAGVQFLSGAMDPPAEETVTLARTGSDPGAIAEVRAEEDSSVRRRGVDDGASTTGRRRRERRRRLRRRRLDAPREVLTPWVVCSRSFRSIRRRAACSSWARWRSVRPVLPLPRMSLGIHSSSPRGARRAQRARRSFCETSDHLPSFARTPNGARSPGRLRRRV